MNVNSGGPHLLLFERDQQLMALLISEFQLAGYECHTARTAVEVFDAIARYPIRLVLVNLAQAAAGRREFWVALDAQRRGRGVQVFTFRCINIAGYGADDPDDRARTVLADMEVEGMLGVMNLVNAIRSRIPGMATNSFSRATAGAPSSGSNPGISISRTPEARNRSQGETPAPTGQAAGGVPTALPRNEDATAPLPLMAANGSSGQPAISSAPVHQQPSPPTEATGNMMPTFTDKIRAVIYPSSRNFSPAQEANWVSQNQTPGNTSTPTLTPRPGNDQEPGSLRSNDMGIRSNGAGTELNRQARVEESTPLATDETTSQGQMGTQAYAEIEGASPDDESGLAQLSRLVREQRTPVPEEPVPQISEETQPDATKLVQQRREQQARFIGEMTSSQVRSGDSAPISAQPLRASPIQDIPIERDSEHRPAMGGQTGIREVQASQQARRSDVPLPANSSQFSYPQPPGSATTPLASLTSLPAQAKPPTLPAVESSDANQNKRAMSYKEEVTGKDEVVEDDAAAHALVEQIQASIQGVARRRSEGESSVASDATLLDIVQSLPPMSAPPPQPQPAVLSGRATRSLGSVLLEGHLVPQQRLEVAQHIQRMLRGVDMNYQLGEILLMFKLLTPDQLLAASLVSYGLISTSQIIALGRIRQELHSIGLEYDLESLLVLFRILTPEQLREVRSSWSG